VTEKLP